MQTRAWSLHMPGLHRIQVVDRIKTLDNTRGVNCFGLYQVHIHYYFLDCHVIAVYSKCLTQ